jgi:hypothetical protein
LRFRCSKVQLQAYAYRDLFTELVGDSMKTITRFFFLELLTMMINAYSLFAMNSDDEEKQKEEGE